LIAIMLIALWQQHFPPEPTFTEEDVSPDSQVGKVFIVTDANQGIGLELVKMLYPTGATIYVAGRARERVEQASHVGTNCVAPLLFTQDLLPQLQEAAKTAQSGSVRTIWTGSLMIESHSPPGGMQYEFLEKGKTTSSNRDYAMSKVGNWYLAVEAAERWEKYGIFSVVQNPGKLRTNIYSKTT
jgi:NAD(P)-dependent dehydrogenase (short-subunit alcohol dehydrogenase family)